MFRSWGSIVETDRAAPRSDQRGWSSGGDTLTGTSGNDSIYGQAGDDTLTGGLGNDTLQGGLGSDTYMFNLGDGQDTVFDNQRRDQYVAVRSGDRTCPGQREGIGLRI